MLRLTRTLLALAALAATCSATAAVAEEAKKNGCIIESAVLACYEEGAMRRVTIQGRDLSVDAQLTAAKKDLADREAVGEQQRRLAAEQADGLRRQVAEQTEQLQRLAAEKAALAEKLKTLSTVFSDLQVTRPAVAPAPDEISVDGKVRAKNELARLYSQPDVKSELVAKLKHGTPVKINATADGWYRVTVKGQTGYLRHSLVTLSD